MTESVHDILIDTSNSMRVYNDWFGPPAYRHVSVVVGPGTDSLPGLVYAWPFITAGYSSLVAGRLCRNPCMISSSIPATPCASITTGSGRRLTDMYQW